jgi:hypothetical protein
MKKITYQQIKDFHPCYDPIKFIPENWEGTALDILNISECPINDRLWAVLRNEFFSDKELRLFAVWCARTALSIPGNENKICSDACDVAERYANGNATYEELSAASAAAASAAYYAASSAASSAAYYAASYVYSDAWLDASAAARADQIEQLKTVLNNQK